MALAEGFAVRAAGLHTMDNFVGKEVLGFLDFGNPAEKKTGDFGIFLQQRISTDEMLGEHALQMIARHIGYQERSLQKMKSLALRVWNCNFHTITNEISKEKAPLLSDLVPLAGQVLAISDQGIDGKDQVLPPAEKKEARFIAQYMWGQVRLCLKFCCFR